MEKSTGQMAVSDEKLKEPWLNYKLCKTSIKQLWQLDYNDVACVAKPDIGYRSPDLSSREYTYTCASHKLDSCE